MKKKLNNFLNKLKKQLKKLINLIKKNIKKFKNWRYFKLSLILSVILVIFIIVFVCFVIKSKKYTDDFYQTILKKKYEYEATYEYENGYVENFNIEEYKIDYTISPIYFKDDDKILFGQNSSIILLNNHQQYYLKNNFIIEKNQDKYLIQDNEFMYFIIFNGDNLFFFSEPSKLYVDDKQIELGASSYCLLWNDTNLEYYNSTTDTSELIEFSGNPYVQINDQQINLKYKSVSIDGQEYLFQTDVRKLTEVGDIDD